MKPLLTSRTRSWNSRSNSNPHTSPRSAAITNPSPKSVAAIPRNPARLANAAVPKAHRRSPLQSFLAGILWFGPRREHSSAPAAKSRSRRAQGLSRLAALRGHPQGLALTGPSTAASSTAPGLEAQTPRQTVAKSPRNSIRWNSVEFTPLVTEHLRIIALQLLAQPVGVPEFIGPKIVSHARPLSEAAFECKRSHGIV
jgi:hypothetical protein